MGGVMYKILYEKVFANKRSAIKKDPALQAAIVANQAAELSEASLLSESPSPDGTYVAILQALNVLDMMSLKEKVAEWACSTPDSLESVEACTDALLLWVPPADLGPGAVHLQHRALLGAVNLLAVCPPRAQPHLNTPPILLSYLQTTAAAAGMLLQQGAEGLLDLASLGFLGVLLAHFLRQEGLIDEYDELTGEVLDLSEAGRPLKALQIADSLIRLAAQLPAALEQRKIQLTLPEQLLRRLMLTLVALQNGMESVSANIMEQELESPDFMEAARGFMQSLAKFGMRLALPDGLMGDFPGDRLGAFTTASNMAASALDAWISTGRPGLDASDLR